VKERFYTTGESYFSDMIEAIDHAREKVDLEVYIIRFDPLGRRIVSALHRACQRGVRVRFVVDGFGAAPWIRDYGLESLDKNLEIRVFHPLPIVRYYMGGLVKFVNLLDSLTKLNRRNHKKVVLIDEKIAFVGSHNFWEKSLVWKEIGVKLEPCPEKLLHSFTYSWSRAVVKPSWKVLKKKRRWSKEHDEGSIIELNFTYKARRRQLVNLCDKISKASERVWMMTPYFVPPMMLLKAMTESAGEGKDVRLVLPRKSDYFFMQVISRYFFSRLLAAGVKIYEYGPEMLHAKAILVDDSAKVGSVNFNYRSFFHDLEVMVVLQTPESNQALEREFLQVFEKPHGTIETTRYIQPWWKRVLSHILLRVRNWL
jgi:cardiolipin synthase